MAGKVNPVTSIIIAAFCFLFISCFGQRISTEQGGGVYHRVKKGETLYKIAQVYKINSQYLAEVNNIDNPELIEAGRVLFIPNAQQPMDDVLASSVKTADAQAEASKKVTPVSRKIPAGQEASAPSKREEDRKKYPEPKAASQAGEEKKKLLPEAPHSTVTSEQPNEGTPKVAARIPEKARTEGEEGISGEEQEKITLDKTRFIWPVVGKVIAHFGIQQNGMFFNGIKIAAKEGVPVVASAVGTVIFSAPLKDYGETIIIKHEDSFATVYTNLGQRMVKRDDHVKRGDRIALSGKTEINKEPVVHFEIRHKNKARNPLFFLP